MSVYDSRVLLFPPEIRFSLKPCCCGRRSYTLLSDVSLQLAHNDASRLRSFARNLARQSPSFRSFRTNPGACSARASKALCPSPVRDASDAPVLCKKSCRELFQWVIVVGLNENRLGMQSTCRCDEHVGVDVLAGEIAEEEPSHAML